MNFISLVKKVGHGAEVVGKETLSIAGPALSTAALIDPALAPVAALVSGISRSVLSVSNVSGTSDEKKTQVLSLVEALTPAFTELLLAKNGHKVADEARFAKGVDAMIEGILDVYKSFGAVPVSPPPPIGA